jgi:succinyl-CoA synthetase beta subunit
MNIHEYQAKVLLQEFGVPISRGVPVLRAADSAAAAKTLPGPIWVVKSQIHAGGRGKGKFRRPPPATGQGAHRQSVAEVRFAGRMLSATLVTVQTGNTANRSTASTSRKVPTSKGVYLSILVNRETSEICSWFHRRWRHDVAHNTPEKSSLSIDPATGIMAIRPHGSEGAGSQRRSQAGGKTGEPALRCLQRQGHGDAGDQSTRRHQAGPVACSTPKCAFDDNAMFNNPEVALRDETEEDAKGNQASKHDSITLRSTAPSAAWSTEPGWRWRP